MDESRFQQILRTIQQFLRENGYIIGPVSLAALVAFAIRSLIMLRVDTIAFILLGLGCVLGAAFILGNPQQVRNALTKRGTRYGLNAAVMSLAFVAIMVLVNYVAEQEQLSYTHDLTESKIHTLSPQSEQVVAELDQPVDIVGFFTTNDYAQQESFENLLDQYERADANNYIQYKVIDPDSDPFAARQYDEPYRGLRLASGDRVERVYSASEQDITGAILKVTGDEPRVVYFLTGHGEHDVESSAETGYSSVAANLRDQNYEVRSLNLAITDTVPSDATAIVIAGPTAPLLDEELPRLQSYLATGGRALVMHDPFAETNLNELLSDWQVSFGDGIVVDPTSAYQLATWIVPGTYAGTNPISQNLSDNRLNTILLESRGIIQGESLPAGATFTALLETTPNGWIETSNQAQFDELDIPGPVTLVASIDSPPPSGEQISSKTRIVLAGDSDFASNSVIGIPGNSQLFLNAINWLAEEEQLIAIGPKSARRDPVVFDDTTKSLISFVSIFGIPLAILAAGIVVWLSRRSAVKAWSQTTRSEEQ